jgi:chemotaxis protein methyltransferase CheR
VSGFPGESVEITDAEFARVRALAMQFAGISIAPTKKALVVGRWGRRLAHYGLSTFGQYLALLSGDDAEDERQICLDLLTTNETSFFREPKHFEFLNDTVLKRLKPGGKFRVWSAACSSGEEPYSVAMLLAGVVPGIDWEVLGTDISARVLRKAAAGIYPEASAAAIPAAYRQRFCLKGSGPQVANILIDRALRARVRFSRVNLNERPPDFGKFDVILLRNVMIYFDAQTKARVVAHLAPALKPGGYFIIGHCDTLTGIPHELETYTGSIYMKPLR